MRRTVSGLLTIFALFAVVASLSCQQENSLRIVSVDEDGIVLADIGDYGVYRDPTDPEAEPEWVSATNDVIVPVVVQYVEIGSGLPTWTPYVANLSKARVKFAVVSGENPGEIPDVNLPIKISVTSDPTGEKTVTAYVNIMPAIWLIEYFGGPSGSPPEEVVDLTLLRATLTLEGVDEASGKAVRASADVQIRVGDYWDDPSRIGQ